MKEKLAIVIPAYKADFLRDALESIASQTSQQFHLYIGDDNSPQDLYSIVRSFEGRINLTYKKFEANLGGQDLVAHWDRCIDLTHDEEWIWLFSDDDVMGADCVETFFEGMRQNEGTDLFHFNIKVIDRNGQPVKTCNPFPERMAVNDFFSQRIQYQVNSTVVEYIFSRKKYLQSGFINFDLAWCSDDATWIEFGRDAGIVTLAGPTVYFRESGINISSDLKDRSVVLRKVNSSVAYIHWVKHFFKSNGITDLTTDFTKLKWISSTLFLSKAFSIAEKKALIMDVMHELDYIKFIKPVKAYMYYLSLKSFMISLKKQKINKPATRALITVN